MLIQQSPIVDLVPIQQTTTLHKARAEALQVTDQISYVAATSLVVELRAYVKDVKNKLGPGINSAKAHLDFLKNQQTQYVSPIEDIIGIAERKAETWVAEERRQAAAQQAQLQAQADAKARTDAAAAKAQAEVKAAELKAARIEKIREMLKRKEISKRKAEQLLKDCGAMEEAAKAAAAAAEEEAKNAPAPVVTVKANVPTVSGIKRRTNPKWRWKPNGEDTLVRAALEHGQLLRPYIMANEVTIGQMVRTIKDAARVEALIPGIEYYEEESI